MRHTIASIVIAALTACGDPGASPDGAIADGGPDAVAVDAAPSFVPGDPVVLSAGSPGNDEDPAVLRARDGSIYVAWYSHAAGDDVVISRTLDGVHWSSPVHVTSGAPVDYGPSLFQDQAGVIHAAWFRWAGGAPPGKIVHARATAPDDGLAWDAASEVDVTHANATDDWVPSLAANPGGELVVAFARNTCPPPTTCYGIASSISADGGATWSTPAAVIDAGGGLQHHLPTVASTGAELVLTWDPYAAAAAAPWQDTSSGAHVSLIRSTTGASWQGAQDVTTAQAGTVTLFPTLYADHAGAYHLAWLAADANGQQVVEVPLADLAATPAPLPIDGYSPRVVATPTPGVFLAAWVGGAPNERDIYVRVFR